MKIKKILEVNLQNYDDVKKAIQFNMVNDYEYIIIDKDNLIKYDNLAYLLRVGYKMNIYSDYVELKHKNYKGDE